MDQMFNTIIARKMVLSKYSTELKPILLTMQEADESKSHYATRWADFTYADFPENLDDFFEILPRIGEKDASNAEYLNEFPTTFSRGSDYMNMESLINFVYPSEYLAIKKNKWHLDRPTQLEWINDLIRGRHRSIKKYKESSPKDATSYNGGILTINMMILFPFASFQYISDNIKKNDYDKNMDRTLHYNVASIYRKNAFA
jgi:hypothetical protein